MDNDKQDNAAGEEPVTVAPEAPTTNRVADDIRERMSSLRPEAADSVKHAADAAHHAADNLRKEEEWIAQLVDQGASKLSNLAETLRTNDLSALLGKTEEFARRQPVLFAGAAMALGFALTRAVTAARSGASCQSSREPSCG